MKITNHVPVTADARAQVVGTGRPGLATARQALAAGAEISLSGPSPRRPAAVRDDRPGPARHVNPPVVDAVAVSPRAVDASAAVVGAAVPRSALGRPLPGAATGRSRDGGAVTRPSVSGGTGSIGGIGGSVTRPSVSGGTGRTGGTGGAVTRPSVSGGTGGTSRTGGSVTRPSVSGGIGRTSRRSGSTSRTGGISGEFRGGSV